MTLREHVYAVKGILAHGVSSNDFSFSNSFIAHFLQIARARLLEQKADKYHHISEQSFQSLCLHLEKGSYHNCCNTPDAGCVLLKSTIRLPKTLDTRFGNFVKVMYLDGKVIPHIQMTQNELSKYSIVKANPTGWFIHDQKIYIINNTHLEKVYANALFDNPSEIENLNCNTDSSGTTCPAFQEEEFPIDADLTDPLYRMTIDLISISKNQAKDNAVDMQDAQR